MAGDDVVATQEEAERSERPPLLVLEPLRAFLDEHGIGSGDIEASPLGDGRFSLELPSSTIPV